jgi:uncharacterized protein (DUF1499 family)
MLYGLIAAGVAAAILFGLSAASWRRPALGLIDQRLRPCGDTPNCVCSQCPETPHHIEPLAFDGDAQAEFQRLQSLLESFPRTTLVEQRPDYLRYEVVTRIVRYVDDVEFLLDPQAKLIHVRSASRVGRSDFGVNRARVEEIRRRFAGD